MTLKIAVFAPIPIASISTAIAVKRGILPRLRSTWPSCMNDTYGPAWPGFNNIGSHRREEPSATAG